MALVGRGAAADRAIQLERVLATLQLPLLHLLAQLHRSLCGLRRHADLCPALEFGSIGQRGKLDASDSLVLFVDSRQERLPGNLSRDCHLVVVGVPPRTLHLLPEFAPSRLANSPWLHCLLWHILKEPDFFALNNLVLIFLLVLRALNNLEILGFLAAGS